LPQSNNGPVFISYGREDDSVVRRIVKYLRENGITVWLDNEKLIPGTRDWEAEIEKALINASAVIVVLSPNSKNSEWVRREIGFAENFEKLIIPVLVSGDEDNSIPIRLITSQYIDLRQDEKQGLNKLKDTILSFMQIQKTSEDVAEVDSVPDIQPAETGFDRVRALLRGRPPIFWVSGLIVLLVFVLLGTWMITGPFSGITDKGEGTPTTENVELTPASPATNELVGSNGDGTPTDEATESTPFELSDNLQAKGIDVPSQNGAIDWPSVKDEEIDFAFLEASQGENLPNQYFENNWSGAKSAGLLRGAYHVFDPDLDASVQVENFLQSFGGSNYEGEIPPAVKVETTGDKSNEEFLSALQDVLVAFGQKTGLQPVVYSDYYILANSLIDPSGEYPEWLLRYPLWIAQNSWDTSEIESQQPDLPNDWSGGWAFWRYKEFGSVTGVETLVGLTTFNGSPAELQALLEASTKPETEDARPWGIDVSKWQGEIDWEQVKNEGVYFVFVRATSGTLVDSGFQQNWDSLAELEIPRGAYMFFRGDEDPQKQAEIFASQVTLLPGDLPPVLDIENFSNETQNNQTIQDNLKTVLIELENLFGRRPIIYSAKSFTSQKLIDNTGNYPDWLAKYPLWIGWYPLGEDDQMLGLSDLDQIYQQQPILVEGWKNTWLFWQFSQKGRVDGVDSFVDLNVFNGTPEEFQKYLNTQ